jgi:hypothetical protein
MAERIAVDVVEILPSYLGQVLPGFAPGILSCIAKEGGGRYRQVSDPGLVDSAVWSMVEEARSNLSVSVLLSDGKPLTGDSTAEGGTWGATLYPSGSVSPIRTTYALPAMWAAPTGDYTLRVWYSDLSGAVNNVRIDSGSLLSATVNLHAGELAVSAVDASGMDIAGDFRTSECATRWELETEDGEAVGRGCVFPGVATVQAGSYKISLVSDRYAGGEARIEVPEGGTAVVVLVEGSGRNPGGTITPVP